MRLRGGKFATRLASASLPVPAIQDAPFGVDEGTRVRPASRNGSDSARLSRDLLRANGITDEYTDHIQTLIIGEQVTGIPAYR